MEEKSTDPRTLETRGGVKSLIDESQILLIYLLSGYLTIGDLDMCCLRQNCEEHRDLFQEHNSHLFMGNVLKLRGLAAFKQS